MPPNLDRSVDRDEGKGHDNKTFHLSDENLATRKSYDMAVEGFSNSSSSIPDSDKKSKKKKKKGKDGEEKKPDGAVGQADLVHQHAGHDDPLRRPYQWICWTRTYAGTVERNPMQLFVLLQLDQRIHR